MADVFNTNAPTKTAWVQDAGNAFAPNLQSDKDPIDYNPTAMTTDLADTITGAVSGAGPYVYDLSGVAAAWGDTPVKAYWFVDGKVIGFGGAGGTTRLTDRSGIGATLTLVAADTSVSVLLIGQESRSFLLINSWT